MRVLQTCTLLVGTAAATTPTAADISTQFTAWQRRFDGVPGSLAAFAANVKLIEAHNARHDRGETSFRMGINQFAALTAAEFKDLVSRPVPVMDRHALGDVVPLSQTDVPAAVEEQDNSTKKDDDSDAASNLHPASALALISVTAVAMALQTLM